MVRTPPMTRLSLSFLSFSLLCFSAGSALADPIVIDDFVDDLMEVTSNVQLDGSMLGGEVDITVAGLDAATFEITGGVGYVNGVMQAVGEASFSLVYDGEDNSGALAMALGGVDLTDGGANDKFEVTLDGVSTEDSISVRVIVWETLSDYSLVTVGGITEGGTVVIPFADFTDNGAGGDFASAEAVSLLFFLADGEKISIDSFSVSGSPDVTAPIVKVTNARKLKEAKRVHKIMGLATDVRGVSKVEVKAPRSKWKRAKLKPSGKWTFKARGLRSGINRFKVRAYDESGNVSRIKKVKVRGS